MSAIRIARRKREVIKPPTGKAAVAFQKLVFLPKAETHMIVPTEIWKKIDFRCLKLMKAKHLRASCIARENEERRIQQIKLEKHRDTLGGVWTFGSGYSGQLGHGDVASIGKATQIKCLRGAGVWKVFAGFDSDVVFAVTKKGDVYTWGCRQGPTALKKKARLDKLYVREIYERENEDEDGLYGKEEDENSNSSEDESDDESEEDEVDPSEDIFSPVLVQKLSGEELSKISVGRTHCCAMTYSGDVFTWGQNDHSQLGNEPEHHLSEVQWKNSKTRHGIDAYEPLLWSRTIPENKVVTSIAVGTDHTMAVASDGELFIFGSVFATDLESSLSRSLAKLSVVSISCGSTHAALITTNGNLYTWGSGDGGRLGHGDNMSYVVPKLVETFKNDVIIQVSCSNWHSSALMLVPPLLAGGYVYTWGSGRRGQLGLGGMQIAEKPCLVEDLLLTHVVVKEIYSGMYHNVVLSVDDEVFTWGSNVNGCLGRPEELDGLEEDFCAVPGKVEGLDGFLGRVCSVACGREFTVIATKPYTGPPEEEVLKRKEEEEERRLALERAEQREEEDWENTLADIEARKIELCIEKLNAKYPKCAHCGDESVCPGFQNDPTRPSVCKHCLHDKRKHSLAHSANDKNMSLENVESRLERIGEEVDYSILEEEFGLELE